MQLNHADIKDDLEGIVKKWFELDEGYRVVYGPLLESFYNPSGYAETQFLSFMQSLEALHRRQFTGLYVEQRLYDEGLMSFLEAMPSEFPKPLKSALVERLKYGNEVSLRKRLKELLSSLGTIKAEVTPRQEEFIECAVRMRNRIVHAPHNGLSKSEESMDVVWLMIIARRLLSILLFRTLGVPDKAVLRAISFAPRI